MANGDFPRGFIPVRTKGKAVRVEQYPKTAAVAISKGDLLKRVAAGTVQPHQNGNTDPLVGVAAESQLAAATAVAVHDDPEQEFVAQVDGTYNSPADNGQKADITNGAGPSSLGQSGQEVNAVSFAVTATLPLTVERLAVPINDQENLGGAADADIVVTINRHASGKNSLGI